MHYYRKMLPWGHDFALPSRLECNYLKTLFGNQKLFNGQVANYATQNQLPTPHFSDTIFYYKK